MRLQRMWDAQGVECLLHHEELIADLGERLAAVDVVACAGGHRSERVRLVVKMPQERRAVGGTHGVKIRALLVDHAPMIDRTGL